MTKLDFVALPSPIAGIEVWGAVTESYSFIVSLEAPHELYSAQMRNRDTNDIVAQVYLGFRSFEAARQWCKARINPL